MLTRNPIWIHTHMTTVHRRKITKIEPTKVFTEIAINGFISNLFTTMNSNCVEGVSNAKDDDTNNGNTIPHPHFRDTFYNSHKQTPSSCHVRNECVILNDQYQILKSNNLSQKYFHFYLLI